MDELDDLEDIYFGKRKIKDPKEQAKLAGLYKYCWFMNPPKKPSIHVPYNLLVCLARVAPKGSELRFVAEKLREYGYLRNSLTSDLKRRVKYALNWVRDFEETTETTVELSDNEKEAVAQLIEKLRSTEDPDVIQSSIFEIARTNGIKPGRFFRILYLILLGIEYGPRLGPYLIDMGKDNAIKMLKRSLGS